MGAPQASAPPLSLRSLLAELIWKLGNWASFWSIPKHFFLNRELAQRAGQFRGSDCGACTYLRDCLLLAEPAPICQIICCCLLNWRSVPGSFGLCFSFFVIRFGDAPAICGIPGHQTYRLYQHAGQFRTFFRLLWHRISDPPAICGISRPREGVPGSF